MRLNTSITEVTESLEKYKEHTEGMFGQAR